MSPQFSSRIKRALMSDHCIIPARRIEIEFTERRSRFITSVSPAFSVEEAQSFITEIKDKYPDATHHVPVFLIGHGSTTIAHCSDDGEPSGTAGQPALAVLRGSGLGDIVLVITRYFGGTKLGTGGLVRAYSDSVRMALEALPRARKISTTSLMFVIPYAIYEKTRLIIHNHHGVIKDQDFGADVTLTARIEDSCVASFKNHMIELTHGEIEFIEIEHRDNTILPLK
jgi:uncharacterized YigZ family protein